MTTAPTLTMETPGGLRISWHPDHGWLDAPGLGLADALNTELDRCPHASHWPPERCAEWAVRQAFGNEARTLNITPQPWPDLPPETVV